MLNMSSFPSMAALCMSYKITYYVIFLQNFPWACTARMPTKKFLSTACCRYFLSQGCSPPLSLCIFCPLPVCLNLHLLSWPLFGSSLRQEPNLLARRIQHLGPCPWLMLTLHTSNSIWYFLILSPFLKRGVRLVFYKVHLLGYLFCMLLQLWHKSSGPVTWGFT